MGFLSKKKEVAKVEVEAVAKKPDVEAPEIPIYGEDGEGKELGDLEAEAEQLEIKKQAQQQALQSQPIPQPVAQPQAVQPVPTQVVAQPIPQELPPMPSPTEEEEDRGELTEAIVVETLTDHEQRLQKIEATLFRLRSI